MLANLSSCPERSPWLEPIYCVEDEVPGVLKRSSSLETQSRCEGGRQIILPI